VIRLHPDPNLSSVHTTVTGLYVCVVLCRIIGLTAEY